MATRETSGTNMDPGLIQRVVAGVRYAVSGVSPVSWFGPGQPIAPLAQDQAEGRAFDYPVGYNTRLTPRTGEGVTFDDLRGLAQYYDILRLVIETRKDQIEAFEWEIVAKDDKQQEKFSSQILEVAQFFEQPSLEHDWSNWLRTMLEDLFVIDAVAIYPRMNRGGKLASLDIVDGATIKRVIDDGGRTPLPPDPAYQQVLKGIPAVDYSSDMLIYMMRNPRSYRLYGFSPVEQIIMTVNIAIRRQVNQLQYYTEGNIPEAICGLPPEWSVDMVRQFQAYWDSVLEGNTAAKRHMKFVPFDPTKIKETKDANLKDEFDEWLARVVCFAFSLPPTAFVKQNNRATAEQADAAAKEEGLMPLMRWLKRRFDYIIHRYMNMPELEFRWKIQTELDPAVQAEVDDKYIRNGTKSIDEVREGQGLEPIGAPNMIFTVSGVIPVDQAVEQARVAFANQQSQAAAATAALEAGPVAGGKEPVSNEDDLTATKFEKMMKDLHQQPDIHVNVAPAEVTVHQAPITVNHNAPQTSGKPVSKMISAHRDVDGSFIGEVVEKTEIPVEVPMIKTVHKTVRAKRNDDGSLSGEITENDGGQDVKVD